MPSRATKKTNASASPNKKVEEKPKKTEKVEKHEEDTKSGHKRQREPSQSEDIFFVEKILDKKKFHGIWRYKVKWQGYSEEECTWEPAKGLGSVKDMITEFNKTFVPPKEDEEEKEEEEKDEEGEDEEKKPARKTAAKEKMTKSKTAKPKGKDKEKEKKKEKEKDKENDNDKTKKSEMGNPEKKVKTDKPQEIIRVDCGHFKLGDKARQITTAKKENNQVLFTVEWKKREGGIIPGNTKMTNEEIRKYDKDLLLDFYEARLKFVKPPAKPSEVKSASKSNPKEPMEEEHESKHSTPQGKESDKASPVNEEHEEKEENEEQGSEVKEDKGSKQGQEEEEDEEVDIKDMGPEKSVISEENKPENQPGETVLGGKENVVEDVENEIDDHDQPIYADISFQVAEEMRVEAYDPSYTKPAGKVEKKELDVPKQDLQLASPQEISEGEGEGENNRENIGVNNE